MRNCCLSCLSYTAFASIYSETDRQTDRQRCIVANTPFFRRGCYLVVVKKGHYYKILVGERENETDRQTDREVSLQLMFLNVLLLLLLMLFFLF